jgi:citrate lyase subunit beta/citryl-CoA lyase
LKVIPQIESTSGLADIKEILSAGKTRFIAAAFGADDFTADFEVHRTDSGQELDFARKYFSLCCHARRVISIDTPYVKYKDLEGLKTELDYLKSIGMQAKFAIHPVRKTFIHN